MLYQKKPTLNKCVFKSFAKVAGLTVRSLNSTGNSFQQLGPATAAYRLKSLEDFHWPVYFKCLYCNSTRSRVWQGRESIANKDEKQKQRIRGGVVRMAWGSWHTRERESNSKSKQHLMGQSQMAEQSKGSISRRQQIMGQFHDNLMGQCPDCSMIQVNCWRLNPIANPLIELPTGIKILITKSKIATV